jgi:precorrin-6B methylase 2
MHPRYLIRRALLSAMVLLFAANAFAQATQAPAKPFEPQVGQPGKDVVWVPTPQALVDKMLDLAKVTPQDYVIDLGSGDGRTVITAARRGARAHGIEYNPEMVTLAKRNAAQAGVNERATFAEADLFASDFSKAQVVTMFLLPSINMKLRPTILNMRPGTRVVSNSFTMEDWQADVTETIQDCQAWCTAHLWIVPAKVEGTWTLPQGALTLKQSFQNVSGSLGTTSITDGKLRGEEITFKAGDAVYTGRVQGNTMSGTTSAGAKWSATKR